MYKRNEAANYHRYHNHSSDGLELQSEGLISDAFENDDSSFFDDYSDLEFVIEAVKKYKYGGDALNRSSDIFKYFWRLCGIFFPDLSDTYFTSTLLDAAKTRCLQQSIKKTRLRFTSRSQTDR